MFIVLNEESEHILKRIRHKMRRTEMMFMVFLYDFSF